MPGIFSRIKSMFLTDTDGVMGLFGVNESNSSFDWDKSQSLSLYSKSLYANAAIRKRAEKTGEVHFQFKNSKGDIVEDGEAAKWLNLLNNPNGWQTGAQFWGLAQKYYDTVGACFIRKGFGDSTIFKAGKIPEKLTLLRADQVSIITNAEQTEITSFLYSGGGKAETIKLEELIYWYNPSIKNPLLGESLLESAAAAIESEHQISRYHANVLKRGGKLETIFKVKNLTTKAQLTELEENYSEKSAEAKQLGRPLFIGGDIESITTALSPQELGFLDTKISTYRDLAMVTGVSKEVLANTDGTTYANADAAIRIFLRETVKPNLKSLCTVLDWRLIPMDLNLSFVDPTPEDKEETRKDLETAHNVEALTTNEMRHKLGFQDLKEEEASTVLVPFAKRPLGDIAPNEPATPAAAPAPVEPTKSFSKDFHPLRDKKTREMWGKAVSHARSEYDRRMLDATRRFFNGQKERVLSSLKGKRKMAVDEVFNDGVELSVAKDTLVGVIRQIFIEQGQNTADTFGLGTFSLTQAVERSLQERSMMFTNSIINTQKEKLVQLFKDSADAQEPRGKLVDRIGELYTDVSSNWAEVIARTEVHAAVSNANLQAYQQAGVRIKIWTWGPGVKGGARPEHQDIDGEERSIDSPFSNGEQYPGEPNCGCTV